jgi:hypothetical protein
VSLLLHYDRAPGVKSSCPPPPHTRERWRFVLCCWTFEFCFFVVFTLTHLLKFSFYDDDDLGLIRTVQFQQDGLYRHDGYCYCVAADLALDTALDAAFRPGDCLYVELRLKLLTNDSHLSCQNKDSHEFVFQT